MSHVHRLQQRRFELKYLIPDRITPGLRDFVSAYLESDEYGVGHPDLAYSVHSLYLDSDDLKTCQASINGTKNRYKIRLRYYDDRPETPVFCEVKARVDNCILKQRCGVFRDAIPAVISGRIPEPDLLFSREPRHLVALQRFTSLLSRIRARPKAHNHYQREAWVSPHDDSVRVTFDRRILIEPHFEPTAVVEMRRPAQVFPDTVVLEIKFTGRFPNWFAEMVRTFNLMQFSSAKYAEGVVLLGEHRFHDGDRAHDIPGGVWARRPLWSFDNSFENCESSQARAQK